MSVINKALYSCILSRYAAIDKSMKYFDQSTEVKINSVLGLLSQISNIL